MKTSASLHLNNVIIPSTTSASNCQEDTNNSVTMTLMEKELWLKFNKYVNEMIVTKNGRRMFPVLKASISGLDPASMYSVMLDFVLIDNNRWKYVNGEWVPGGKPEPHVSTGAYVHPDSPNFGAHWMKEPINFSRVKLTNKATANSQQVMLNSLHKYEPRIHIMQVGGVESQKTVASHSFQETRFIAVTAYQNEDVTSLKIKYNPFAKAFLDAKESQTDCDQFFDSTSMQSSSQHHPHLSNWLMTPSGALQTVGDSSSNFSTPPMRSADCFPSTPMYSCYGKERQAANKIYRKSPYSGSNQFYNKNMLTMNHQPVQQPLHDDVGGNIAQFDQYAEPVALFNGQEWNAGRDHPATSDQFSYDQIPDEVFLENNSMPLQSMENQNIEQVAASYPYENEQNFDMWSSDHQQQMNYPASTGYLAPPLASNALNSNNCSASSLLPLSEPCPLMTLSQGSGKTPTLSETSSPTTFDFSFNGNSFLPSRYESNYFTQACASMTPPEI